MKNVVKNDTMTRRRPGVRGSLVSVCVVGVAASSACGASFKTSTHVHVLQQQWQFDVSSVNLLLS